MREVEEMLSDRKLEMDKLEVPEELETRLNTALEKRASHPRKKHNWKIKAVAAIFIAIVMIGYNFNTLALYGKKFIGYDNLMNGDLKHLNDLGKGQPIEKSYTFKNGSVITFDGIMVDDNQFIAFYTLKDSKGRADKLDVESGLYIESKSKSYLRGSSVGTMNDTKTEARYVRSYEVPDLSEKNLSLNFTLKDSNKDIETTKIDFILDKNKAMGHTLKKEINKSIKVDEGKISFESITASPTVTVINGSIQNILELAIDTIMKDRFRLDSLNIKLIANGKEIADQGCGTRADMEGVTFQNRSDALPKDLKKLQIELVSFSADHDVKKKVDIQKDGPNKPISILGQSVEINKVYESKGDTYVTITTEDSVILTRVYLIIDGKKVELERTILKEHNKKADRTTNYSRTLKFKGTGSKLQLDIKRMTYEKVYNQFIDVPIN